MVLKSPVQNQLIVFSMDLLSKFEVLNGGEGYDIV